MKVKVLTAFNSKLLNPCRKLLLIFKFQFKNPLLIKALRFHPGHTTSRKTSLKKRMTAFLSIFRSLKQPKMMDQLRELRSVSDGGQDRVLFPSPLTPAFGRTKRGRRREAMGCEDVEDACRSFENYLVEMIVEEGKVRDLADVEELLYCWKNLKCPVFIDLVCRFYGELCKDLFSIEDDDNIDSPR